MSELRASSIFDISGWNTVITGAGSGLGKILAKAFLVNGASVTLVDILQDRLDATRSELDSLKKDLNLKGGVTIVQGDVGTHAGVDDVVATIRKSGTEQIDTLIMAAGIRKTNSKTFVPGQPLSRLVEATRSLRWEDLETSFHVNVYAQYYMIVGLLDLIGASAQKQTGRGSIICFSSVASQHTAQFVPAYQASKAAVDHLVRIMAAEFADHYSTVICKRFDTKKLASLLLLSKIPKHITAD